MRFSDTTLLSLRRHIRRHAGLPGIGRVATRLAREVAKQGPREIEIEDVDDRWTMRIDLSDNVGSSVFWFGTSIPALLPSIRSLLQDGDVAVDVGANIGESTLRLARAVAPSGQVHSFEPLPDLAARLRHLTVRNELGRSVAVHELALADWNGHGVIHSGETLTTGWRNRGSASLAYRPDYLDGGRDVEVRVSTLDRVLRNRVKRVRFVKIDVEGLEREVIQGMKEVIRLDRPAIAFEVNNLILSKRGHNPQHVISPLERFGYEVYALDNQGRIVGNSGEGHSFDRLDRLEAIALHRDDAAAGMFKTSGTLPSLIQGRDNGG